jgi:hypothetical protein
MQLPPWLLSLPVQRKAAFRIEPRGQWGGRISGDHQVVDVISGIAGGRAVRSDDFQDLGAEESGQRLAGCDEADELLSRAGGADTAVSIYDPA